jgi:hypothetical protein
VGKNSIQIVYGNDVQIDLAVVDHTGAPFDLTGCTLWWTAKTDLSLPDGSATFQYETPDTHIVVDVGTGGTAHLILSNSETAAIEPITFLYYDVKVKDTMGIETTVVQDTLNFIQPVTDAT